VILFCIYLANKSKADDKNVLYEKIKVASEHHKYKSPIEFINDLTSLAPTNFSKLNEFSNKVSPEDIKKLIDRAGGIEALNKAVDNQFGAMPCEYSKDANGRIIPKKIATFLGTDNELTLVKIDDSDAFNKVLLKNNIQIEIGSPLSTSNFIVVFASVRKNESCVHYVNFIERTRLIYASRALWSAFRN
jgi:hypothetical protein